VERKTMIDLSVIIPARNEKYLLKTVDNICHHVKGQTEIIVGIDGEDTLKQIPYLVLQGKLNGGIRLTVSVDTIGQRAMTNKLVKMAYGKYILKCDAHNSFSTGFDTELLKVMDDKTIMSPRLLSLDAEKWQPIAEPKSASYCFDSDLIFQFNKQAENDEPINETMCLQGSAFIVNKQTYFDWNLGDETLGSWGGQGVELGIKAYLNGGICKTNKNCFNAHLFRKEFPYQRDDKRIAQTLDDLIKRFKNKKIAGLIRKYGYPCEWDEEKVNNLPFA